MCNPTAIAAVGVAVSAVSVGVSYASARSSQKSALAQAQDQMDMGLAQYYRDQSFSVLEQTYQSQQYALDTQYRLQQLAAENAAFMSDAQYRQDSLAQELLSREQQLQAENLSALGQLDYAQQTMDAAYDAAQTDIELLNSQYEQISGQAQLDIFERKRQAMKEAATIRVSQGESGIFGNTALKELANTMMQSSYDTSLIEWNLKNAGAQKDYEVKAVKSTAVSRTNEALSGVVNRYATGSASEAMNPAVVGLTI